MPVQGHVEIIKPSISRHVRLSAVVLFCGSSVETNRARNSLHLHYMFEGQSGANAPGPKHAVATTVTGFPCSHGFLGRHSFLGESRQGIVLSQNSDYGSAATRLGHKRGGHIGNPPCHFEAVPFQLLGQQRRRLELLQGQFGKAPHSIVQRSQQVSIRINPLDRCPLGWGQLRGCHLDEILMNRQEAAGCKEGGQEDHRNR